MEKKKLAAGSFMILFIICFSYVLYRKADDIYVLTHDYKESRIKEREGWIRHEVRADTASFYPLEDEEGAWYTVYHFISHAGGGIAGRTDTNSRQAWEHSYEMGSRVIETDFGFQENSGSLDQMSCEDVIGFMQLHPDLYVVYDLKEDCRQKCQYLVNMALYKDAKDVLERIVIGFYEFEDMDEICSVYPFSNLLLRQHAGRADNYYEIAEFCIQNGVHAVDVSEEFLGDQGIQMLIKYGIRVYAETDFISDMQYYYGTGMSGAVTNWLYEPDWDAYIERKEEP